MVKGRMQVSIDQDLMVVPTHVPSETTLHGSLGATACFINLFSFDDHAIIN